MKKNCIRTILASFAVILLAPLPRGTRAEEFKAGAAVTDITPRLGTPMAGYYHARGADGVLDPLFSKALVLEHSGEFVALVALDLIAVTREVTESAREIIERDSGIAGRNVMISATHAHTGPELAGRGKRVETFGGKSDLTIEYTEKLPSLIAQSVAKAKASLQASRLSVARGVCEGLAFNRRYFMRDGTVGWNPGKKNPNIVLPAGPSDPELSVLYVEPAGASGPTKGIATYVNFAMHPDTTSGSKFSADWPGALGRMLAGYHGTSHVTLLGNGTCGNINHCDFGWDWLSSGAHEQHRIGVILAGAVLQTYKQLAPVTATKLRVAQTEVQLDLPKISPEEVSAARETINATPDDHGGNFMKLVRAYRALDVAAREGKPHKVEVQAIAVGDELAFVSLPGEVFVELGIAIKKRSPFRHTFVVELANDNIGYIPDHRSYAEGNYEPESARCAPGSGERLAQAAVELLTRLHNDEKKQP